MTEATVLSAEDVATVVADTDLKDYIEVVREGYRQRGNGAPAKPRQTLHPEDDPWGMLTSYMAILPETGTMGGYMYDVGFAAEDGWLTTSLWDAETGQFLSHLDGNPWNPQKTGATGALAVDELAREDAKSLAVIGSGTQARAQVLATALVRELDHIDVYSPTPESRETFAEDIATKTDVFTSAVESSQQAVSGADIIVTATSSKEPVFDGTNLDNGTHITAMGNYDPDGRELDSTTIQRASYFPDLRERVFQDAGSFLWAMENGDVSEDDIEAELGDVVAGKAEGRESDEQITIFDSGGTGIETVAAATMVYKEAIERGIGDSFSIVQSSRASDLVKQNDNKN